MNANTLFQSPGQAFVKASAIAKLYDTTAPTIYKWAKMGLIPSVSFQGTVRFDLEAVRAVIEGGGKRTPTTSSSVTALASAASELGETLTVETAIK